MPTLYFTVTNDLSYDQRMYRICSSLQAGGFEVVLVGVERQSSQPLIHKNFRQIRIRNWFSKGKLFYLEYNIRLFFFLLFRKMDGICAIDLDTALPCSMIAGIKKIKSAYDAHELFCEMKEIVSRPHIYKIWKWIERRTLPKFDFIYTVNQPIADELSSLYSKKVSVIRNITLYQPQETQANKERYILYQGAVNEGRCFEQLIPAMKGVSAKLIICGDGNFMGQAKELTIRHQLQEKIIFKGMLQPAELKKITNASYIGITLFEKDSKNNYYSLANRFFDYIHGFTPQVCMDYPVYQSMNKMHEIAVMIAQPGEEEIQRALNRLLNDDALWNHLHENCKKAALEWNWQSEEKILLNLYRQHFA